jgi:hypothetical protein
MPKVICRLLVVLACGWTGIANAGLILNAGGGTEGTCGSCSPAGSTFGWAFTVNSTITVDGLGIWDFDADGIGPNVSAGLWIDGGALLASAVISSGSALEFATVEGGWRFEDIAELVLTTGNYVLGFTAFPSTPSARVNPLFSTIPEVTYTGPRDSFLAGAGLIRPDDNFAGVPLFGANIRVAAVPTPATVFLLGLGIAALGYSRRERQQHV